MSTDVHQETQRYPQPPREGQRGAGLGASAGGRWRRGLLVIGVIAVVALATAVVPDAISSREINTKLTHTITRGGLVVSVTESGSLESSENTEIKCKVRGARIPILWVIEGGTVVKAGDDLVRLDTLLLENTINERSKYAHWSRSSAERWRANVARAELAIAEYSDGRYRAQLMTMEKDLAVAESNLRTARSMLAHAEMLAASAS